MEIRNPNKSHLPALHALLQRALDGAFSPQAVAERVFYDEHYDPNHVWMAREGGQMLGFLHTALKGAEAQVKLLVVAPERRRSGLGRDLLSRAEYRLSGEGARHASVGPTPPREFYPGLEPGSVAESFFVAQGYEAVGEVEEHWTLPGEPLTSEPPDLGAAIAFAQQHAPEQWAWVEDCLACRPAKAVFDAQAGLALAEPGESVGPLWPAPPADPVRIQSLLQRALGIASQATPRDPRGLRLLRVEGSQPLGLPRAASQVFVRYIKPLH